MIPRLRPVFEGLRNRIGERFIVGGDLNTGRTAEQQWPGYGHGKFWTDVEAWGFKEPLPFGGHERQSFWREWLPTSGHAAGAEEAGHQPADAEDDSGSLAAPGTIGAQASTGEYAQDEVGVGDVPPAPRFPHRRHAAPSLAVVPLCRAPVFPPGEAVECAAPVPLRRE